MYSVSTRHSLEGQHQGNMELLLDMGLAVSHELPAGTLCVYTQKGIPDTTAATSWCNEAEEWPCFWTGLPSSSLTAALRPGRAKAPPDLEKLRASSQGVFHQNQKHLAGLGYWGREFCQAILFSCLTDKKCNAEAESKPAFSLSLSSPLRYWAHLLYDHITHTF